MAMVVTEDELVVFTGSRRSMRRPVPLGRVHRDRIAGATFPYIGGAWKTVRVHLRDGSAIHFLVDPVNADAFAAALNAGEARPTD